MIVTEAVYKLRVDFGLYLVTKTDEVFRCIAGGYDLEGFVDGWVNHSEAIFTADGLI
jgi:hypothetical protein